MRKKALCLILSALIMLCFSGCSDTATTETSDTQITLRSEKEEIKEAEESALTADYPDAESFESALNNGENLEGKTVVFTVGEVGSKSIFGYNIYAGEHLNFVSSKNPYVEEGDTVTVKATEINKTLGSWVIHYEMISCENGGRNIHENQTSEVSVDTAAETSAANLSENDDSNQQKKGFDEKTNQTVKLGKYTWQIPDYYKIESESDEYIKAIISVVESDNKYKFAYMELYYYDIGISRSAEEIQSIMDFDDFLNDNKVPRCKMNMQQ